MPGRSRLWHPNGLAGPNGFLNGFDHANIRRSLQTSRLRRRVIENALGGGVTRSLALDAHGKSLSSSLLDLEIEAGSDNE